MLKRFISRKTTLVFLTSLTVCLLSAAKNAFAMSFLAFKCPGWNEIPSSCGLCSVMMVFFDAANFLTLSVATALEGPMTKLLAACLLLWLGIKTMMYFAKPFSEANAAEFLMDVGKMMFTALIALAFIRNGCSFVFNYLLTPFFTGVSSLVELISRVNSSSVLDIANMGPKEYSGVLPDEVREAVGGLIGGFSSGLNETRKIGFALMCKSFSAMSLPDPPISVANIFTIGVLFPNPYMFLMGLLVYLAFSLVGFIYALTFMDTIFRLSLTLVFIPIVTVAWVFPSTRKYTSQVWRVLVHTAFVFVCATIFLTIIAELSRNAFGADFMRLIRSSNYVGAWQSLSPIQVPVIRNLTVNPLPFFVSLFIALVALIGSKIPDEFAARMTESGFDGVENCGRKTLKFIINTIIQIICWVLTIISFGAGSILPVIDNLRNVERSAEELQKLKDTIEKLKKLRKRLKKAQEYANKTFKKTGI